MSKQLERCPNCGHTPLRADTITDRFEYTVDDQATITIEAAGVPVEVCDGCGESYFGPAAARARHVAVCRTLGLLSPEEIRAIRQGFGLTQAEFAQRTGIGEATISRWERGRLLQSRAMDRYLRLLQQNPACLTMLAKLADPGQPLPQPMG